ncbi:MAG: HPr family phosphocarrier protein, partial [Lachnospiraceae bacterium]|nr:HPr family phosphocarrier protein [Lachnospiraceae bacterium]
RINAKSIMGMMSLDFSQGDKLVIEAEGADAEAAVEEIANYVESRA